MTDEEIMLILDNIRLDISLMYKDFIADENNDREHEKDLIENVHMLAAELIRLSHENFGLKQTVRNLKEKEEKHYRNITGGKRD